MSTRIRLSEHRRLTVGDLARDVGLASATLTSWLWRIAEKTKLVNFDGYWVETDSFVGIAAYENIVLEVVPKLIDYTADGQSHLLANLTYLLSVTESGFDTDPYPAAASQELDLLDALAHQYGRLLKQAVRRQPPLRYETSNENLRCVRGKVLFHEDLKRNLADHSAIYCAFDELTVDNPIARVLKKAAQLALSQAKTARTREVLQSCLVLLREVSEAAPNLDAARRLVVDKHLKKYRLLWPLALLLLSRRAPGLASIGSDPVGVEFDMNKVFERYVGYLCQRYALQLGIKQVAEQYQVFPIDQITDLTRPPGGPTTARSSGYIDILLDMADGTRFILDSKYKSLSWTGLMPNVSNADLFQIAAYQRLLSSDATPLPVLVYPQADRNFHVRLQSPGSDLRWDCISLNLHLDLRNQEEAIVSQMKSMIEHARAKFVA